MSHFLTFAKSALVTSLLAVPASAWAGEVPADLQGRYVSVGECALFDQSDAALTVSASKLQFYESSCDLDVAEVGDDSFSGAYVCQGEGQFWLTIYKIRPADGGIEVSSKGLDFNGALSERTTRYKSCD
ncbi:MAG: hypothetical protein H6882_06585 [Rhodobiaceae bacterium]|nr:hypothetical protein [Rhodobiaceae bacterium]